MKLSFAVVFERTPNNYAAYPPDLPGCISTGETWDDVQVSIREAIVLHVESLLGDGEPLPESRMTLEEAESYHDKCLVEFEEALASYNDDDPVQPVTVKMVEVEVALQPA